MRHLRLLIPLVVVLALLAAGCGSQGGVPSNAVAKVGDQKITKDQFDAVVSFAKATYKSQKRVFPKVGTPEFLTLQGQIVQFLVQRAEFEQKGADLGIKVSDSDVQTRIDQIKKQNFGGDQKKFQAALAAQGETEASIRDDVHAEIVADRLFAKVTGKTSVSAAAVAAYYRQHKQLYAQPASRTVRHILVAQKSLADSLYSKIKGGASFAALAKRYSIDPGSKAAGGKLTISKGQTVPPFDKVAFSLAVNQISPPVHTQYGWHVIQALTPVKPAATIPLAQAAPTIKTQLVQAKRNQQMTNWVADVKKSFASKVAYQKGYAPTSTTTAATTTG